MKIFGVHFHNWIKIYDTSHTSYMGHPVSSNYISHRYCPECGQAQEYLSDWTSGPYWGNLSTQETLILNSLTYVKDGIHYVRRH